jgi:2-polyprenyl-6-hydroxyphenyl methylase/3-demethylubiquinone-9 3-methyltransferase
MTALKKIIDLTPVDASTVSQSEVDTFRSYDDKWWDPSGPFKPLHAINPIRMKFIKERISRFFKTEDSATPFQNLTIADVGCGAGIATEPMARLGGMVTGIDMTEQAITQARLHAIEQGLDIDYRLGSVESLVSESQKYDVVMALEIIEHVENPELFVQHLMAITKPEGVMFLSTLNRTWSSYIKAILAAEYVLKWVPQGTHHWDKFVKPSELASWMRDDGFNFSDIKGIDYDIMRQEWRLVHDLSTNYIICASRK